MSTKPRRRKPATTPTRKRLARLFVGLGTVALVVALAAVLIAVVVVGQGKSQEGPTVRPVAEVTPAGGDTSYQGGPRMRFAVQAVDFGKVPLDVPVRYAFEFTNVGDATLQITDVDVKLLEGC
ncbi:MAG: hypothetical protein Q8P22_08635 [Chloroflexota bacterium]|nr:hypothetical protein [Chloroflexota bacterium]